MATTIRVRRPKSPLYGLESAQDFADSVDSTYTLRSLTLHRLQTYPRNRRCQSCHAPARGAAISGHRPIKLTHSVFSPAPWPTARRSSVHQIGIAHFITPTLGEMSDTTTSESACPQYDRHGPGWSKIFSKDVHRIACLVRLRANLRRKIGQDMPKLQR